MVIVTSKSTNAEIKDFSLQASRVFRNIFFLFSVFLVPFYLVALASLVNNQNYIVAFYSTLSFSNYILLFYNMIRNSKKVGEGRGAMPAMRIQILLFELLFSLFILVISFSSLFQITDPQKNIESFIGEYFVHWLNAFTSIIAIIFLIFRFLMSSNSVNLKSDKQ